MKLNFICLCSLTKDSLLPQGKNGDVEVVLVLFAQKEEWLEFVERLSCKSGFWAGLCRCPRVELRKVSQSPQLWLRLVRAEHCCLLGQQRLAEGCCWWWGLCQLPRINFSGSPFCSFRGQGTGESNTAMTLPLRGACSCALLAGWSPQTYCTGKSQAKRLYNFAWNRILWCFCESRDGKEKLCNSPPCVTRDEGTVNIARLASPISVCNSLSILDPAL